MVLAYQLHSEDFIGFELPFSDKEVTAWGGLAVTKQMLDHPDFANSRRSMHQASFSQRL